MILVRIAVGRAPTKELLMSLEEGCQPGVRVVGFREDDKLMLPNTSLNHPSIFLRSFRIVSEEGVGVPSDHRDVLTPWNAVLEDMGPPPPGGAIGRRWRRQSLTPSGTLIRATADSTTLFNFPAQF